MHNMLKMQLSSGVHIWKQVLSSSWGARSTGHKRHGPKIGGCAPFLGELGPYLTQCGLGRGLPPYQVAYWSPHHTIHHNGFTDLFPGPPGWVSARRELLDFTVEGKINRGRHTDHPDGRHSIRTSNQCKPLPSPGTEMVQVTPLRKTLASSP